MDDPTPLQMVKSVSSNAWLNFDAIDMFTGPGQKLVQRHNPCAPGNFTAVVYQHQRWGSGWRSAAAVPEQHRCPP